MTIAKALQDARRNGSIVSIYTDENDWGRYSVGYVDSVTDVHVRLRAVSGLGEPAGFEIRALSEIAKFEYGGKYERKIEKLVAGQGAVFNDVNPKEASTGNLIVDSLMQSIEESIIVVVWGGDHTDSLVGYVEAIDADVVTVRLIDQFGEDDGCSVIRIDEITAVNFNTRAEQARRFLNKGQPGRLG